MRALALVVLIASLASTACIPYAVGSTARTVPVGKSVRSSTAFIVPGAFEQEGDSVAASMPGVDSEWRIGLDDRSDVGVRVPSWSGAVVNYKRRLDTATGDTSGALSLLVGGGVVNWGEHAHFEASLIASAREDRLVVPYGGLRIMQVAPLSTSAVNDSPTAGGFFGVRFGKAGEGFSPEIGIFHDKSALGIRDRDFIIVPSITVHGGSLRSLFGRRMPGW